MKRRDFVRALGSGAALGFPSLFELTGQIGSMDSVSVMSQAAASEKDLSEFYFTEPFDGGIIHEKSGSPVLSEEDGRLKIRVSGIAPTGTTVIIIAPDGLKITANRKDNQFFAEVFLKERFSEIKAELFQNVTDNKSISTLKKTESSPVKVIRTRPVWAKGTYKRFKFQIDDNSFWLRDLARKNYKSLFDCFYLEGLRKLYRKYGARFELNCFYSTPERDFDLSQMPERWKSEFEDNAHWLRLAFHADNEFPDNPYQATSADLFVKDFDKTADQLRRFAGKAYTPPAIIHWGNIRPETYIPLFKRGVRTLSGYFIKSSRGNWVVSFQLPDNVCRYMLDHEGYYDFNSGLAFSKLHIVCNNVTKDRTKPTLQSFANNPNTSQMIDFLTHEQYFWPFYKNYLPDHFERLDAAIGFAVEQGHKPVWHHEGFFSCE